MINYSIFLDEGKTIFKTILKMSIFMSFKDVREQIKLNSTVFKVSKWENNSWWNLKIQKSHFWLFIVCLGSQFCTFLYLSFFYLICKISNFLNFSQINLFKKLIAFWSKKNNKTSKCKRVSRTACCNETNHDLSMNDNVHNVL